jgi:hypothetical protein
MAVGIAAILGLAAILILGILLVAELLPRGHPLADRLRYFASRLPAWAFCATGSLEPFVFTVIVVLLILLAIRAA